jgi:hypothetical protein
MKTIRQILAEVFNFRSLIKVDELDKDMELHDTLKGFHYHEKIADRHKALADKYEEAGEYHMQDKHMKLHREHVKTSSTYYDQAEELHKSRGGEWRDKEWVTTNNRAEMSASFQLNYAKPV